MALTTPQSDMTLMNLPIEMIDKILSYLSYDQIAKLRAVNRMLNTICSDKLNKGFTLVNQFHNRCLKGVKTMLPRRESERRHHPLARHSDILMAVETRLSMLSMTFSKYIEAHLCCFIPGKVLDEAFKVLHLVNSCLTPTHPSGHVLMLPRPHDFLQEYRDVSSMAMEHFDDKILPGIKEAMKRNNPRLYCFKGKTERLVPALVGAQSHERTNESTMLYRTAYYKLQQMAASTSAEPSGSAVNNKSPQKKKELQDQGTSLLKLYRGMLQNKIRCNTVYRYVDSLNRNVKAISKKMKLENSLLRQQMVQQKTMIKHLRRELRDTRVAMNVMSKDLNQLKIEQSPSRGTKRKRESCDEDCEPEVL